MFCQIRASKGYLLCFQGGSYGTEFQHIQNCQIDIFITFWQDQGGF